MSQCEKKKMSRFSYIRTLILLASSHKITLIAPISRLV